MRILEDVNNTFWELSSSHLESCVTLSCWLPKRNNFNCIFRHFFSFLFIIFKKLENVTLGPWVTLLNQLLTTSVFSEHVKLYVFPVFSLVKCQNNPRIILEIIQLYWKYQIEKYTKVSSSKNQKLSQHFSRTSYEHESRCVCKLNPSQTSQICWTWTVDLSRNLEFLTLKWKKLLKLGKILHQICTISQILDFRVS